MEEESITGDNNVIVDTFSHSPNAQIKNTNAIFTSEKLDKLDERVYAVKILTTNDSKYYE